MKVALYCRISDPSQDAGNQLPALEEYVRRRGWELVRVYSETESAWAGGHQRELARALRDARAGRFSVLLVWALDRLSREGSEAILALVRRLGEYGVKVISFQEPWTETSGATTELLLALTGWVARMESQRRSERTKAGLERARANGAPIGKRGPDKRKRRKKRTARIPLEAGVGEW